jgi:hypothetical protein
MRVKDGFDGGKLLPLDGSPSLAFIQEFDGEERLLVQDARAYQPEEDQTYELAILDAGVSGDVSDQLACYGQYTI